MSCNEERIYLNHVCRASNIPRHLVVLAAKALRRIDEGTLAPWLAGRLRALAEAALHPKLIE